MSALAGPGDLAGSLREMAVARRHLLSVWAAGMLAEASLGLETQPLPRLSHWLGDAQPESSLLLLPLIPQPHGEGGACKGGIPRLGSMLSPGLTMSLKPQG